jgi:hypothetical protein
MGLQTGELQIVSDLVVSACHNGVADSERLASNTGSESVPRHGHGGVVDGRQEIAEPGVPGDQGMYIVRRRS